MVVGAGILGGLLVRTHPLHGSRSTTGVRRKKAAIRFTGRSLGKLGNRKLYERLSRLLEEPSPDADKVRRLREEVARRDPAEYEAAEIEALASRFERHTVMESDDILLLELKYCEDYLAKPAPETTARERALRRAKLAVVRDEMKRRPSLARYSADPRT